MAPVDVVDVVDVSWADNTTAHRDTAGKKKKVFQKPVVFGKHERRRTSSQLSLSRIVVKIGIRFLFKEDDHASKLEFLELK